MTHGKRWKVEIGILGRTGVPAAVTLYPDDQTGTVVEAVGRALSELHESFPGSTPLPDEIMVTVHCHDCDETSVHLSGVPMRVCKCPPTGPKT